MPLLLVPTQYSLPPLLKSERTRKAPTPVRVHAARQPRNGRLAITVKVCVTESLYTLDGPGVENLPSSSSSELIVRCRALQVQARALALEPARHLLPDALDRVRGRRHGLSNLISGLPGQR